MGFRFESNQVFIARTASPTSLSSKKYPKTFSRAASYSASDIGGSESVEDTAAEGVRLAPVGVA